MCGGWLHDFTNREHVLEASAADALHKVVLGTAGDDGAQSTSLMCWWREEPPEALVEFDNLHQKQKREVP